MRSQCHGFRILGIEAFDDLCPEHPGGAQLGNFHKVIHPFCPEEGQAGCKDVDIDTGSDSCTGIFQSVGQSVCHFQICRGSGFMHVISGDADAVEFRHFARCIAEYIGNDAHGSFRRIDIGVTHHVFFEDVVLDGAIEQFWLHALFFRGNYVKGHDRDHCSIHGHGDAHLIQRDFVEENLHIQNAVHGHTGFAHITDYAGMIGIISTMRGQVKGNGKPFLPHRQVAAIKGVGFFRGGKARVLTDGPGTLHVHAGVRPSEIGGYPAHIIQMFQVLQVTFPVQGLHLKLFVCMPVTFIYLQT